MGKDPQQTKTEDTGDDHGYFAQIPHTITRGKRGRGLSLAARWFYVYLKSTVYSKNGVCTRSTTTIVQESQLGRATISAAKKELVEAGLITVTSKTGHYHDTDKIRIVDIWLENMEEFKDAGCTANEQQSIGCTSTEQPEKYCTANVQPVSDSNHSITGQGCTASEQCCTANEQPGCTATVPNKKEDKDLRENLLTGGTHEMTTEMASFLRSILDRIPAKDLETAPTFHDAVHQQLLQAGATVTREYMVPDRGDGRTGYLDLLVTAPWVIGLELDAVNPRAKSVRKLQFVDGVRVILLRGRGPVPDVPEGIHDIMRHTYSNAIATPKTHASRLVPESFVVTPKMQGWAEQKYPGVNVEYETEKMRDFEFKDAKTDWNRTWSRWIRTAWERLPPEKQSRVAPRVRSNRAYIMGE